MAKLTWTEFGWSALLASGVILGIALLDSVFGNIGVLKGFLDWGKTGWITAGQALFGGVAALGTSLLIANLRK